MNKAQTYPTHVYWDERDHAFVAIAPDLPGCSAFGETKEKALKELEPAIVAWIETAMAAGEPVPEPSPLPKPSNYSGKVLLRMPVSLHERLAKDAEAEGVSLNQWMVTALSARTAFHDRAAPSDRQQELRVVFIDASASRRVATTSFGADLLGSLILDKVSGSSMHLRLDYDAGLKRYPTTHASTFGHPPWNSPAGQKEFKSKEFANG